MPNPGVSAIEIFKRTAKNNCGECGLPNCMAFAALAAAGQKDPNGCPYLPDDFKEVIAKKAGEGRAAAEDRPEALINQIMGKMREIDFADAAKRLGGEVSGGRLVIHCLGKIFELDRDGRMYSLCHVNHWVHVALLQYVIFGKGTDPSGEWVTFRELKQSRDWERFFNHRCQAAMKQAADSHPELFLDILELFGREYTAKGPVSEHSVVIYPLPKVPFLICYTPRDGAFESTLSLFFDRNIEKNLRAQGVYMLGAGIVEMIKRIMERHDQGADPLARARSL